MLELHREEIILEPCLMYPSWKLLNLSFKMTLFTPYGGHHAGSTLAL